MEHHHILVHVNKIQERCRVPGRLLVVPRDKKSSWSYQCTAADLHSVFGIHTHNDAVNIHPCTLILLSMQTSNGLKHSSTMPTLSLHKLVQLLMSGRNTLLRNARFDRLPTCLNKLIHVPVASLGVSKGGGLIKQRGAMGAWL